MISTSIYYIANAGIYLESNHSGILVDGLFDPHEGFDPLPSTIENAILHKQPPFTQLSALFFTHSHADHYSPGKVSVFLKQYPQTSMYQPDQETRGQPLLFPGLYPVPSRHLMDKGRLVPHRALFLHFEGKNYFFSGDADPVFLYRNFPLELLSRFQNRIDMAFINPFFLSLTPGRKLLDTLAPNRIFVYHMPLQVPDSLRYHEILKRGMSRYPDKLVYPLVHFMERIS